MKDEEKFINSGLDEYGAINEASYAYLIENIFYDKGNAKILIQWNNKTSRNYQILQLKKICPVLKDVPIKDLYTIINKNDMEWEFAVMGYGEGINLAERAKEVGLMLKVIKIER